MFFDSEYDYSNANGDINMIKNETTVHDYTFTYVYDRLGRLKRAKMDQPDGNRFLDHEYDYDIHGNVEEERELESDTTHSFSYDAANELLSRNGVAFTHDQNGNLLSSGDDAWAFDYNAKNQTTSAVTPDGSAGAMDYLDADQTERAQRDAITK